MISINYNLEGIKVETTDLSFLNNDQLPLTVKFVRNLSSREMWSTVVGSYNWVTFPDSDMIDVQIEDAQGVILKRHRWDVFIDIGAADGYYAIGLLMSKRVKRAICFELTAEGQDTIKVNWNLNDKPGNIEIYGDVLTDFEKSVGGIDFNKVTVLVDIEGAEF